VEGEEVVPQRSEAGESTSSYGWRKFDKEGKEGPSRKGKEKAIPRNTTLEDWNSGKAERVWSKDFFDDSSSFNRYWDGAPDV